MERLTICYSLKGKAFFNRSGKRQKPEPGVNNAFTIDYKIAGQVWLHPAMRYPLRAAAGRCSDCRQQSAGCRICPSLKISESLFSTRIWKSNGSRQQGQTACAFEIIAGSDKFFYIIPGLFRKQILEFPEIPGSGLTDG